MVLIRTKYSIEDLDGSTTLKLLINNLDSFSNVWRLSHAKLPVAVVQEDAGRSSQRVINLNIAMIGNILQSNV